MGLALVAGVALPAAADDGPSFRVSGFGTVAAVKVDQPGVEFWQPGQTSGAGETISFKSDSRLGVQLDGTLNPVFSGTVQVLAKHAGQGDDRPRVEWAFGKAKLGDAFAVRVGRIGAPFFVVSDFREVGYANTWLRTPTEVYGQLFSRTFDGADVLYAGSLGGMPVTAQAFTGKATAYYNRKEIDFKKFLGLNATVEVSDGVTLRAGHTTADITVNSVEMLTLVGYLAATPFAAVGQQINCTDRKSSFSGVGVAVERGNWVGSAEYTLRRTACYVPDTSGWYLMAGYRFGNFTPYGIVSKAKIDDSNVVNNIPRGLAPTLTALAAGVDKLQSTVDANQHSTAVGLRWDAWRNTAVKAEWARVTTGGGNGFFRNVAADSAPPTKPVNVLSVAVDFIF